MAGLRPGDAEGQAATDRQDRVEYTGYAPTAFDRRNVPRIERRPRPFDRRDLAILLGVALVGAVVGLALRYVNSLPPDQAFLSTIASFLVAGILLVAVLTGFLHWASGRPQVLATTVAFVAAVTVAYPFGPHVAPPVDVAGTYELTLTGIEGTRQGAAGCRWAAGRAKVETLTVPDLPFVLGASSLTVEFFGLRTRLATPVGEYRWGGPESVTSLDGAAPAFSDDHASGNARVFLLLGQPIEGDDVPVEVRGTLRWACPPAPAG